MSKCPTPAPCRPCSREVSALHNVAAPSSPRSRPATGRHERDHHHPSLSCMAILSGQGWLIGHILHLEHLIFLGLPLSHVISTAVLEHASSTAPAAAGDCSVGASPPLESNVPGSLVDAGKILSLARPWSAIVLKAREAFSAKLSRSEVLLLMCLRLHRRRWRAADADEGDGTRPCLSVSSTSRPEPEATQAKLYESGCPPTRNDDGVCVLRTPPRHAGVLCAAVSSAALRWATR